MPTFPTPGHHPGPVRSAFTDATAVQALGDGEFTARLVPEWGYRGHPNGGYLLAVVTRAAIEATGRAHAHAVSASYVRAATGGPARIRVERVRSGRLVDNVRATLWQRDRIVVDALLVLGAAPGEGPPGWQDVPDPGPAPFGECEPVAPRPGLLELLDIRYDPGAPPRARTGGTGEARIRGWVGFRDGAEPDGPTTLLTPLLAADALPPSVLNIGLPGWAPTVQISVYLRGTPAPGPLGVSVAARMVSDGWFDEVSDVVDSTGRLVAQSRQIALVGTAG
ncbi:thioesterase family protein [Streptomyces sp. NPDC055078]